MVSITLLMKQDLYHYKLQVINKAVSPQKDGGSSSMPSTTRGLEDRIYKKEDNHSSCKYQLSVFGIDPIKRFECLKCNVALQRDFKLKLQFK